MISNVSSFTFDHTCIACRASMQAIPNASIEHATGADGSTVLVIVCASCGARECLNMQLNPANEQNPSPGWFHQYQQIQHLKIRLGVNIQPAQTGGTP